MKTKKPQDFKSYKAWENMPHESEFRIQINKVETDIQAEQQRYMTLSDAVDKQYRGSDDLDRLEATEAEFEQCKASIKELKKQRSQIKDECKENERKRAEAWQKFICEVAESRYLPELYSLYQKKISELEELTSIVRVWHGENYRTDLRTMPPAEISGHWLGKRISARLNENKQRMQDIADNEHQTRKLKRIA